MGLLQAIFGAKPPYGTPPFAPPHPNTGGAEVPTTPETMPRQHGISGFIDRVLNPTNSLGQFGQALVASGGGPLGNAMAYMMQARAQAAEHGGKFADWKQQYDYEVAHPKPSSAGPHYWESNDGSLHAIGDDGKPIEVYHDPTPKMQLIGTPETGYQWVPLPGTGASGASSTPAAPVGKITPIDDPAPADAPPAGGTGEYTPRKIPGSLAPNSENGPNTPFGHLFSGLIGQESGGRAGIRGQPTRYGTPLGMTQLLPDTAREMASKLGVPWRPELLTGDTPEAAEYQQQLGEAYLREGLSKYGGDPAKALMYYHGGPNERLWGPKTRGYASSILGRR
jgi:hypothetical protein